MLRALADTELGLWLTISSAATVRSSTATTAYRQAAGRHDNQRRHLLAVVGLTADGLLATVGAPALTATIRWKHHHR
jgi:hypothetical protein